MVQIGSGVGLDDNFDLAVSETGDTNEQEGVAEMFKDLAYRLDGEMRQFLGDPLTPTLEDDATVVFQSVVTADPRVDSVVSLDISSDHSSNELQIESTIRLVDDRELRRIFKTNQQSTTTEQT